MSEDQYLVTLSPAEGLFRDRASKFIAYARPARSEAAALATVEEIRKLHPKCNHHCYAYRIGEGKDRYRANDDGEPSGSAGRPILGQIDSRGLSDTVVIVARYFGGTKLGVPGLINAYKTAAALALDDCQTGFRQLVNTIELQFDYKLMSPVMNAISRLNLEMQEQNFTESASLKLDLPRSQTASLIQQLKAFIAGVYLEEVTEDFEIDGLTIVEQG